MTKVQLVSAPLDPGKIPLYEDGIFAPLNHLWLGSYLCMHGHDVEIIDGQYLSPDQICARLDAPIVGISFNIFSTHSLDSIAEAAKGKGSSVVVGGQAATPLWRALLKNNSIDYVVRYDGEAALRALADQQDKDKLSLDVGHIPNIAYRRKGSIQETPIQAISLSELPAVDWSLPGITIQNYWDKFAQVKQAVATGHTHTRPLSSFNKKGCPMRQGDRGCSFCSRTDYGLRTKTPRQVYDDFSNLARLGADRIEEFSDSWLYHREWLSELAEIVEMNGPWGAPVRVYADTRHIVPQVIPLMRALNIDSVILGVESGNEQILYANGKPNKIEQILRCADLLGEANIRASPSYVLGLIGETQETLEDTFALSNKIRERCTIEMSYYSIMTPFPGSRAWRMLLQDPQLSFRYEGKYHLDVPTLKQEFLGRFTQLGARPLEYLEMRLGEHLRTEGWAQQDY